MCKSTCAFHLKLLKLEAVAEEEGTLRACIALPSQQTESWRELYPQAPRVQEAEIVTQALD